MGLWDAFKHGMFPPVPPKPADLGPDFDTRPDAVDEATGTKIPYAVFNKGLSPKETDAINTHQRLRNLMFKAWVGKAAEGCGILGEKMEFTIEQLPENWFTQPNFAMLQISGGKTDFVNHLHMDSWTPRVAVHILIGRSR